MYMALVGDVLIADRDTNGNPGALTNVGEIELCEISVEKEYLENFTNNTKVAEQDLDVPVKQTGSGTLTLKEATAENLALSLHGTVADETSGSFSGAAFPTGIVAGETRLLPGNRAKVTSLVITDSAGTPATLVAGTHYDADADFGTVTFKNVTGFTQPFKAAGTEGTGKKAIGLLTQKKALNKFLRVQGYNVADEDKRCIVDLYLVSLRPAKKLGVGGKREVQMYEIEFRLIADKTKAEDATLGRYGQYRLIEA